MPASPRQAGTDQADDRTVLIAGDLFYNSTDPYAVCIAFRVYDDTLD